MEYYFTDGRIQIEGKKASRKEGKKADYLLYFRPNFPIAIVEAKDNKHTVLGGMRQAIEYADILKVPFAYSSNGDGFVERDMLTGAERNISMDQFPTAEELWARYKAETGMSNAQEILATAPYYYAVGGKVPRYYHAIAINRTLNAIAKGQDRILLVLATGTGKTLVAFQIMYKLLEAKQVRKILFLADRNILVDQSRDNDFKPLDRVMTKIEGHKTDTSYQVYLSLYHQLKDANGEYYKDFEPDFFDLIIVDECHRSSADEKSTWHEILDYFSSAIHIGMTATPKETEDVSNIHYFGEPLYTYSLKQGIEDGFLAPYKVIRVNLDIDVNGYRPYPGMVDINGNPVEDRIYEQNDFDRAIVVDERNAIVAQRISEYLRETDPYAKTIVFCVDIPHAERMSQALRKENPDLCLEDIRYVTQITGDNPEGKAQLDNFIDPYEKYPVIAVTSRLMSTGVDAKTCKVIALDRPVGSMTEFKQIIGRGTRVREDCGKMFFTILDFRRNYTKFSDPDFDGEPVMIYDVAEDGEFPAETDPPAAGGGEDTPPTIGGDTDDGGRRTQYHINGVDVNIINEKVDYLDANGNLITMSIIEYSRINMNKIYSGMDEFRQVWLAEKNKQELLDQLENDGVFVEIVKDMIANKPTDEYAVLTYIGYGQVNMNVKGAAQKNLNTGWLKEFLIPIPPLAEQYRIVDKIEELMTKIDEFEAIEKELESLKKAFPENLRKSLLQAAIMGKLTEQLPNYTPVDELLDNIKVEKEQLIKEKKIKAEKPLEPIAEDEISFDIPENWRWVRLANICEYIQRGKSPKYSDIKKYPVVAQKCNQWEGFSLEKALFIEPDSIKTYGEERFLHDRDLLWNSTGLGTLGRMAIYDINKNPYELAVADSHVTVIRPFKQFVLPEYLFAYFAGPSVQSVIEAQSDGSTKQKELATSTIKKYIVPLPPIEEQHRIVEKLDKLLPLCEELAV